MWLPRVESADMTRRRVPAQVHECRGTGPPYKQDRPHRSSRGQNDTNAVPGHDEQAAISALDAQQLIRQHGTPFAYFQILSLAILMQLANFVETGRIE